MRDSRCWAVAITLALVAVEGGAAAQGVVVQADATVNTGYTQVTRTVFNPDPMPDPADVHSTSESTVFTELRPGILIQSGSQRLTWRLAYLFGGILALDGTQPVAYTNQATAGLAAELTKFTILNLTASVAQGGNSFLLGQRAADAGQPEIRATGNPSLVTASAGESLNWEAGRHTTIQQAFSAAISAPQDDLATRNSALVGTLSLSRHVDDRNALGLEARASMSTLQPVPEMPPFTSYAASIRARWNHDFSMQWNGLATAGVGEVFTDTGSKPLAIFPVASVAARYAIGLNSVGAIEYTHDVATNLQIGTISLTDQVTARGAVTFSVEKLRVLAFSAGYLHNQPIGGASALVAASTGSALQGDVGFTTALRKNILAVARYSVAYQFDQDGIGPSLIHIVLVGITGRYSNTDRVVHPLPSRGQRVDGGDGQGFQAVEAPADDDTPEP